MTGSRNAPPMKTPARGQYYHFLVFVSERRSRATKLRASFASSIHKNERPSRAIHSLIDLPVPGLKYSPIPWLTKLSTRSQGSFATNFPFAEIIANSFPPIFSAFEPNPLPPPYTTLLSSAKAPITMKNARSISGWSLLTRAVSLCGLFRLFCTSAAPENGK